MNRSKTCKAPKKTSQKVHNHEHWRQNINNQRVLTPKLYCGENDYIQSCSIGERGNEKDESLSKLE